MAHAIRASLRNERQTKLNFAPIAKDDALRDNSPNIATPRPRRSSTIVALPDNDKPVNVKQLPHTPAKFTSLARTASKKRTAAELSADATDATDPRPPTKVTVTQRNGHLLRATNRVTLVLGSASHGASSTTSTSKSGKLAAPTPAPGSQDKRSLRSHDGGSRLKSHLQTYFSNYEEVIEGVEKPIEFLDLDTPIYILDEPLRSSQPTSPSTFSRSTSPIYTRRRSRVTPPPRRASHVPLAPSQSSTAFRIFDFTPYIPPSSTSTKRPDIPNDPLPDASFFASHRRSERKEKQLRNIEKERAMHEKVQLERLLDGLQGPDWLKVMGITGVTDGERKDWEPKRDYFVHEVKILVDKFRLWKQEEKRLRADKEALAAAKEESEEGDDDDDDDDDSSQVPSASSSIVANGNASRSRKPKNSHHSPRPPELPKNLHKYSFLLPLSVIQPTTAFTSFFAKPHLRAAAMGKQRYGRNAAAFGLPIPDWNEGDFELPEDFVTDAFRKQSARSRRKRQRETKEAERGKGKERMSGD